MSGKPIKIAVLGDTRDLGRNLGKAETALDSLEAKAKSAGHGVERSMDGMAGGADTMASKGSQAAGALAGLGGLVGGQFGTAMLVGGTAMQAAADAGDLLNVAIEGGGKIAAKAANFARSLGKAETYSAAAKNVSAIAQKALNAALRANPIGLVVTALVLLVGAIVLAYKKSETFRNIVNGAFEKVKAAAGFLWDKVKQVFGFLTDLFLNFTGPGLIIKHFDEIVGFVKAMPGRIARAATGMFDGIKDAFKSSINWLIGKWNGLSFGIPAIDTHIPGVGKVGGFTLSTPDIPMLASGGIVNRPTLALIGEAGPEAVVPLNGRMGLGNHYHITVVAPVGSSSADIGRELVGHIDAYESAGGRRNAA